MRCELIGLLQLIFNKLLIKYDISIVDRGRNLYITIPQVYLRIFLAYLRYGSLCFGTELRDITVISQNNNNKLIYIFYMPKWGVRLFLIVNSKCYKFIATASEFFNGAEWPERECSEMFGVQFVEKIDNRKLMLDYNFEGYPLLKKFPVSGYEELEYDVFLHSISYVSVQIRDNYTKWYF